MKPVNWIGSCLKDVKEFPEDVQRQVGFALYMAQCGDEAINSVPLVGFGGRHVLEVVVREDGNAYRTVYTVKLEHAVYALHAFQKKSKSGVATPKKEMDVVRKRLKVAISDHEMRYRIKGKKGVKNDQRS